MKKGSFNLKLEGNALGQAAFQNFQARMESGEPFEGSDDGSGWIWAAADLTVESGLSLDLYKSTPFGKRALMVAKQGNVPEMFEKLNWAVVRPLWNRLCNTVRL